MIKLGIIGISEGNGHPYSWAAICNGYNTDYMKTCPFPAIPNYLSQKNFPEEMIKDAAVTHIWTQNQKASEHIARSAKINNVVDQPEDMIGRVDAILLARDDYENHRKHAEPFIKAGLPIYIDKPLAINRRNASKILEMEKWEGQIFTCSALKYANEFSVSQKKLDKLGEIKMVHATVMKSWEKYAVHVLDPILKIFGYNLEIARSNVVKTARASNVLYVTDDNKMINITTIESAQYLPFKITIMGENDQLSLQLGDTFNAFKAALEVFLSIVKDREKRISHHEILKTVEFIEKGMSV